MFQRWRIVLIVAPFLIIAGIYGLFYLSSDPAIQSVQTKPLEESMTGVRASRYDKSGRLYQAITIKKWEHFKNDTVTTMETPSLTLFYPNGKICEISADTGEGFHADLKGQLEKLHLKNNVVIQQTGEYPEAWWELKTDSLVYFPSSQTAMTDERVMVISPSATLESQGMKVYLEQQRVEFINRVKSEYAKI